MMWLTRRELEKLIPIGCPSSSVASQLGHPDQVVARADGGSVLSYSVDEQWQRESGRLLMWAKTPRLLTLTFDANQMLISRRFDGFNESN